MALAPQFADYVCPFSCRMFRTLQNEVFPYIEQKYSGKIQFIFRQQIQPWHPSSTLVHEAGLAVERIDQKSFYKFSDKLFEAQKDYFDESVQNLNREQIYQSLAKLAGSIGISSDQFLSLVNIKSVDSNIKATNQGNQLTPDLKWHIKLGRQNGIHVSPTVLWDGIIDDSIQSSWTLGKWEEWLTKKF
ncbi:3565_t:CDS:2 [Diversispora eburnea]|uniref:3565_t:CDS:1 n=1 Tax=Diversispora eburnea TaxID=1213867 RepID=A0A9N9A9D5_9GLOM|nr:3565_t:CDS:2 [Diversispora eburnea]